MALQWKILEPPLVAMDRVWTLEARQHEYQFMVGQSIAPWGEEWYVLCSDFIQHKMCFDVMEASKPAAKAYAETWLGNIPSPSNTSVHFSHHRDDWETPQELFNQLHAEFQFTVDVAASPENAKCARYFTRADDGLRQDWSGVAWMNPPYSAISTWMAKAYEPAKAGTTVVCLVPARTDTRWWHTWVGPYAEYRFLPGRVQFVGAESGAPFPSVVVVFKPPARS
jgi:phage N-6-adenine-methyltransferase